MIRRACLGVFLIWAFVFAISWPAHSQVSPGQGGGGTIEGRVSDSQQLPLPATTVEVLDAQGVTIKKVVGQDDGRYNVGDLAPGTYTVQFSRTGFQIIKKDGIVLTSGQTVPLDVVLPPERVTTNLTVVAQQQDYSVASKTDIPSAD